MIHNLRLWGIALTAVAAVAVPAAAHDPHLGEFTCPVCHESYIDVFLGPWPFYATMGGLGPGPELRSWSYMGAGRYEVMGCPHCGYCNTITGFNLVYVDSADPRENPFEDPNKPPPRAASRPATQPATTQATTSPIEDGDPNGAPTEDDGPSEHPRYVRLFPARPLDYPTIQANVRKSVDPNRFRYVNAYMPERIEIVLRTLPGLSHAERFSLAKTGAWACDDCGETAMGLEFRAQAIEPGTRLIQEPVLTWSLWERLSLRYQVAEMQMRVGRARKTDLRATGRAAMESLLKDSPVIRRRAEEQAAKLEAKIKDIRARIRQRAIELRVKDEDIPDAKQSGLFGVDEWAIPSSIAKDPAIVQLAAELDTIRIGGRSAENALEGMSPWQLTSNMDMLPALEQRIAQELAADALRDLPLEKALALARKGTTADREGFLMLYGASPDQPGVREFLRELIGPLYPRGSKGPTSLFGRAPEANEEEYRVYTRYMTAIAQAYGDQRTEWAETTTVTKVLADQMECGDSFVAGLKLVPANAEAIRKALMDANDDPGATSALFPSGDRSIRSLCRADAPWMAEIILKDLLRRPRVYLSVYFDHLRNEGSWEEIALAGDWPKVHPGRLIAKHLPDQARKTARDAIGRVAESKATPQEAAAALIPLRFLDDPESLNTLRTAAKSSELVVRRTAAGALLIKRDHQGLDALLDEAVREGRLPAMPPETISLLRKSDLPRLRQIHRKASVPPLERTATTGPEEEHPYKLVGWRYLSMDETDKESWLLAAMGHLGDEESLRRYNACAFEVHTKVGSPVEDEPGLTHTPVSARATDLAGMLGLASSVYCTDAMAKELMDGMKLLPHWAWESDRVLLQAFAGSEKTHGWYRKLACDLASRPTPLSTKWEVMRHAKAIPVPEVTSAIQRWALSEHVVLAGEAKKALAELGDLR
jgi:hypothetical protein